MSTNKTYLDYSITDNYKKSVNPVNGDTKYDYVNTRVWIKEKWLCDEVEKKIERKFYPEVSFYVDRNESIDLQNFLTSIGKEKHLIGTYGDHFE